MYQGVRALGFDEQENPDPQAPQGVMVDKVVDFEGSYYEETVLAIVLGEGGIPVLQHGVEVGAYDLEEPELVEKVTPVTTYNRPGGCFRVSRV